MSKNEIENSIISYLNSLPFCWAYRSPSWVSGLPSIIFSYRGRFIAFEVQTETDKLNKAQENRLKAINDAGGEGVIVESLERVKRIIEFCDEQVEAWRFIEGIAAATADAIDEIKAIRGGVKQ